MICFVPLLNLPERFPETAGCTFGVSLPHFTEHRPGSVLLPESFCVPLRRRVSGLSRVHHPTFIRFLVLIKIPYRRSFCQACCNISTFHPNSLSFFMQHATFLQKNIPVDRSTGMHDWVNQLDLDGRLWYCYQGQNHRSYTHSSAAISAA